MASQQQPRTKLPGGRKTGQLIDWKGAYGFIQPTQPIQHALASKRNGKIFIGQQDVEAELPGVGCMVSFMVYSNAQGLGASNVRPATGAPVQKQIQKSAPAPKAKAKAKTAAAAATPKKPQQAAAKAPKAEAPAEKGERLTVSSAPLTGIVVRIVNGKFCFVKPEEPIEHEAAAKRPNGSVYLNFDDVDGEEKPKVGAEVMFFAYANNLGLGAEHCQIVTQGDGKLPDGLADGQEGKTRSRRSKEDKKQGTKKVHDKNAGKAKGKAKAKGRAGGKAAGGPDLPRKRVTTAPVQGEVLDWKGKYGWIQLASPIEHADAEKNGGKIYVHGQDVLGGDSLEKGATVSFHCYADSRGLGAEECSAI